MPGCRTRAGGLRLSGAASDSDSTITVTSTADLTDAPPYYISVEGEVMLVTAVRATTLSVLRGQLYSTAAPHASGKLLFYARAGLSGSAVAQVGTSTVAQVWGAGPFAIAGDWRHNLLAQKLVGALMTGLALADEDARAADLAERAWNYYYDLTYTYNRDVWSGTTQGGFQFGYRWGRWVDFHLNAAIAAEYAFTSPNPLFGQYWWRTLASPWMDAVPYSWTAALWDGIGLTNSSANITPSSIQYVAAAQTFNAGQALTAQANYLLPEAGQFLDSFGLYQRSRRPRRPIRHGLHGRYEAGAGSALQQSVVVLYGKRLRLPGRFFSGQYLHGSVCEQERLDAQRFGGVLGAGLLQPCGSLLRQ